MLSYLPPHPLHDPPYHQLQQENVGEILIAEPNLKTHKDFDLLPYQEVIEKADIILLLVDHKPFKTLKAQDLKEKILIDTRGVIL